jgi:hypothetical protein
MSAVAPTREQSAVTACCSSGANGAKNRNRAKPTLATSVAAGIGVALLPKCPLCVAALLMSLGMGATGAAILGPIARPGLLALACGALLAGIAYEWRRRRQRRAPTG